MSCFVPMLPFAVHGPMPGKEAVLLGAGPAYGSSVHGNRHIVASPSVTVLWEDKNVQHLLGMVWKSTGQW